MSFRERRDTRESGPLFLVSRPLISYKLNAGQLGIQRLCEPTEIIASQELQLRQLETGVQA